jgi:diguanylate cyclase (GGDEF)-like protein/excisionase family DNA binding protein
MSNPIPDTDIRARIGSVLREREDLLDADLAAALGDVLGEVPDAGFAAQASALILELFEMAVETGGLDSRSGRVVDIQHVCRDRVTIRTLFECVYRAERVVLDELALHEHLGATSEPWALVVQLVRFAALDMHIALAERQALSPASGIVQDPLTTLLARPVLDMALGKEVARAQRRGHPVALALFDVDHLSGINAELGYGAGDRLLERLGILAERFFRNDDWVGRHGEDSIAALLPETSLDDAAALANRFRRTVKERLLLRDHKTDARVPVTITGAVVGVDRVVSEIDPLEMLNEAEAALLRARLNGTDQMERVALQPTSVTLLGAANLLGCTPQEIRRLVRTDQLHAARRGRHYHIDRQAVEHYKVQRSLPF